MASPTTLDWGNSDMAGLPDLLAWLDSKRRVAGRNLSDLINDPANAIEKTADNTLQTVKELPDDPANFLGVGTFIGKGAKTWDAVSMGRAQKLAEQGADPRAIWKETGTWQGPDGHWRQEIPDNAAIPLNQTGRAAEYMSDSGVATYPTTIGGVLSHPQLFDAYSDLPKAHVTMENKVSGAAYYPNTPDGMRVMETFDLPMKHRNGSLFNPDAAKSTTLHELQHAIQQREGFANGGSPETFSRISESAPELTQLQNQLNELRKAKQWTPEIGKKATEINNAMKSLMDDPFASYQRLAGEAEARATQSRMNMNASQRRNVFPADSYDVPLDQLILRDGNGMRSLKDLIGKE